MRIEPVHLTPLQSRLSAIALALVALLVVYFVLLYGWFVAPLLNVNARMHDLRVQRAHYAAAIAAEPRLAQAVRQMDREGASAAAFLPSSDPSTASADLIQRVTDIVAAQANVGGGCSMPAKMPVEPGDAHPAFRTVSVSITLDCGMQPLAAVLHDFNRGRPYLFVDNISLARAPAGRLQAQLTLSGYLRPAGAP